MPIGKQKIVRNISDIISGCYDINIASLYFNVDKFPVNGIRCPYREDKKPSFSLQLYDGRVLFKDFATGESGTIIKLLSKIWNCDMYTCCINILKQINTDKIQLTKSNNTTTINTHSDIKITKKPWDDKTLNYWRQYNISQQWLDFAEVLPVSHFFINNKPYIADQITFAYRNVRDDKYVYKIYQPLSKSAKWYSNYDSSIVSLYNKLPDNGKHLILCSSLKDALCVWCNTGVPCISLQSEVMKIPKKVIDLQNKFDNIYVLYDRDNTGLTQGDNIAKEHGFINIILPEFDSGKDISDMMKMLKYNKTVEFIKSNLK